MSQNSPLGHTKQKIFLPAGHKARHTEPARLLVIPLAMARPNHVADQCALSRYRHFFRCRAQAAYYRHACDLGPWGGAEGAGGGEAGGGGAEGGGSGAEERHCGWLVIG